MRGKIDTNRCRIFHLVRNIGKLNDTVFKESNALIVIFLDKIESKSI